MIYQTSEFCTECDLTGPPPWRHAPACPYMERLRVAAQEVCEVLNDGDQGKLATFAEFLREEHPRLVGKLVDQGLVERAED